MTRRRQKGFTLVEMLASLVITAILIGAASSILMGASQVFKMLDARNKAGLENAVIALEKMSDEIRSSRVVPESAFEGQSQRVAFPVLGELTDDDKTLKDFRLGQVQTVGQEGSFAARRVEYTFDGDRKLLLKRTGEGEPKEILRGLAGVEFSYAVSDSESGAWRWSSETPKGEEARLGAVTIRLLFDPLFTQVSIPGIQKTFPVVRRHPLNATKPPDEEEAAP